MKKIGTFLCILTSTAIGFGAGYIIAEKRYTKMLNEEINKTNDILATAEKEVVQESALDQLANEVVNDVIKESEKEIDISNRSKWIKFDEFETIPEYESEVIFYYPATKEFYNDRKEKLSDDEVIRMIGTTDVDDSFGIYYEDPDCLRMKNDYLRTYYEILRYYTSP